MRHTFSTARAIISCILIFHAIGVRVCHTLSSLRVRGRVFVKFRASLILLARGRRLALPRCRTHTAARVFYIYIHIYTPKGVRQGIGWHRRGGGGAHRARPTSRKCRGLYWYEKWPRRAGRRGPRRRPPIRYTESSWLVFLYCNITRFPIYYWKRTWWLDRVLFKQKSITKVFQESRI